MTRPSRYPVASFGPELLAVLLKGAREEVIIPMPDAKALMTLQMRLHMLRGAMSREKHPQYGLVQRARTSRLWDTDSAGKKSNFKLRVSPNDKQFANFIKEAGVEVTDDVSSVLDELPLPDTPADPTINSAPVIEAPSITPSSPTEEGPTTYDRYK